MNSRNVWIIAGAIVLAGIFVSMAPTIRAWFVMREIEETFEGPTSESGNPIEQAVGLTFQDCHDMGGVMAVDSDGEPLCDAAFTSENVPPVPRPLPTSIDELPSQREVCAMAEGKWDGSECTISL